MFEECTKVDALVEIGAARAGVVGLDLAGGPTPSHSFGMNAYAPAFMRAKDKGLGRTVHAGEGRPAGEIADAIELLGAQRIGHGLTLLSDWEVLDLVLERGVTIEACPTSNVHTGCIDSTLEHPIARWLAYGVDVCVNTDNTLLSDTNSIREHALVAQIEGTEPYMAKVIASGHAAAFRR